MVELNELRTKIKIDLDPGIWLFENQSATGKTRLRKELRLHQQNGERVSAYSYEDYQIGIEIEKFLDAEKFDVIMLDRYDMYNGVGAEKIRECAKKSIVLIDCKRTPKIGGLCDFAEINMTADRIEVVE